MDEYIDLLRGDAVKADVIWDKFTQNSWLKLIS